VLPRHDDPVGALASEETAMSQPDDATDRDLRITAYNENLGFITERRRMRLAKGLSTIEVTDIPALIDPTSVHFTAGNTGVRLVEQNFQFDLADADRILKRYLDRPIEAAVKEGALKLGVLLSYDEQTLVLRSEEGEVSLVRRSEVVDVRLPKLPDGLRARPTLLWLIESDAACEEVQEFSYLTGGIAWHAEYAAITGEDDAEVELAAWISLENRSGASFCDARLQLMAGNVHRVAPPRFPLHEQDDMKLVMSAAMGQVREETLFEYHLYSLDRIVTVADRETKQLALFSGLRTPVTKTYRYEGGRHSRNVEVFLGLENRESLGLGFPLPAGKVRSYKKDSSGHRHFIGEDTIQHTPLGEKLTLKVGTSFDVVGERKVLSAQRRSKETAVEEIEVRIRNRKQQPIEVTARETLWSHWRIMTATHEYTPRSANCVDFKLVVPADGEEVLTFAYRYDG
jgi:hypothetical protein